MPAGDNPHSISEKKAALRESPKEPKNVGNQQPRTSPPFSKDKAAEIVGTKRPQHNGPLNPANPGANGHLVYVRRRLETDHSKVSSSASAESISSLSSKKTVVDKPQEQSLKHQNGSLQTQLAPVSSSPAATAATSPASPSGGLLAQNSLRKQSPGMGKVVVQPSIVVTASPPPRNLVSTTTVPQSSIAANLASCNVAAVSTASRGAVATTACPADPQRSSNQDWRERFIRLQAFLRNNEQSGQEEYIRMLRSLSSVGRSKHAIELENRAVKLLIEEGKELQKMKVLNVLNKLSPTDSLSLPTQHASVMHLAFPPC